MKKTVIFLQVVLVLIGVVILVALLWEPHLEGRNVNATFFDVYFKDPFLAYIYVGFVPFFVALYQACKMLGHMGEGNTFSRVTVKALQKIKYCALITAGFILGAELYLLLVQRGKDDIAGGVAVGLLIIGVMLGMAVAAAIGERRVGNALQEKFGENITA